MNRKVILLWSRLSRLSRLTPFALLLFGCGHERATPERALSIAPAAALKAVELPPLVGEWLQPFRDRDGKSVGWISVPIGATDKRPFVVAVHGAGGRPDGMCSAARSSVGPYPFILCPHSVERTVEASWGSPARLRSAIDEAVDALLIAYDPYVTSDGAVYLGHSQGAMFAPEALASSPAHLFHHAIFFEGLPRDHRSAKTQLVGAEVARLLLVSGQSGWSKGHDAFATAFGGTPVRARHVHEDMGHFFTERTFEIVRSELDWLVGEAPAWRERPLSASAQ